MNFRYQRIGISGHGRCGKDTAAEWLVKNSCLRYIAGTSWWAAPMFFEKHGARLGYSNEREAWSDRHNHRRLWADTIGEYNRGNPTAMYEDCLKDQDLLTGVRWRHEKKALDEKGIVDLWVWIEREGIPIDPTMEYTKEECDIVILNNGTLDEFYKKLDRFSRAIGAQSWQNQHSH